MPTLQRRGWLNLLSLLVLLSPFMATAQVPLPDTRPDLWVNVGQDSCVEFRGVGGHLLPASAFSASYKFSMITDSTCRSDYLFTEAQRNGQRIKLLHWWRTRLVHMDADVMSYNSRTVPFPLLAGDTLSFFREWHWYNPVTSVTSLDNYYSLDTLAYSIELVRASDGVVLAQLDSLGVMPSPQPGTPTINGTRPIIALVKYIIPATLAGNDSAFIGIRLYAHGGGEYGFMRYDDITVAKSQKLNDPRWIDYLRVYGFGLGVAKFSPDYLAQPAASSATIDVIQKGGGVADIQFNPLPMGSTTVAVYDAAGTLVFYPYAGPSPSGAMAIAYQFPISGLYIVALLHDGRLAASTKVTITK